LLQIKIFVSVERVVKLKLPQSYIAKIPNEYKREYIDNVCRENFLRMLVIAVLLVVFEPLIAIFTETPDTVSFYLALGIALFNLIFLPILYFLQKNVKQVSKFWSC